MNTKKGLVSAVIATHNHKNYLRDCLSSLRGQGYKDFFGFGIFSADSNWFGLPAPTLSLTYGGFHCCSPDRFDCHLAEKRKD